MNITNFLEILKEEIDISGISISVVKQFIPKEKWNAAFQNILKRHGMSKFGKLTVSDMFKDPSEGWFFHYSKYRNKYFEGQYSFQFVQTFSFDKNLDIKNVVSDKDVSWNNGNFMVDSINKQIVIEKAWRRNTLGPGQIENLDEVKTALTIVTKLHPELINYKFNYPRMKLKFVSDVLKAGEDELFLFWDATNESLKQAYQSKYSDVVCWFDSKLAKGEIRDQRYRNPIESGSVVVKLKFDPSDTRLTKKSNGSFKVEYISKEDIVSYKAPENFDINEDVNYSKFIKFKFLEEYGVSIYTTKNLEKLKRSHPSYIEQSHGRHSRPVQNFIRFPENSYLYRCFNEDGIKFFVAEEGTTDREIIYSLLLVDPDLFFLSRLNVTSFDREESEKIINEFILQNKLGSVVKIIIKNIIENRLALSTGDVPSFCERVGEYIEKI